MWRTGNRKVSPACVTENWLAVMTCSKTWNDSALVLPGLPHVSTCTLTTALLLNTHVCFATLYAVKPPNASASCQGHFGSDLRLSWMLRTVLCFHSTQFSALQEASWHDYRKRLLIISCQSSSACKYQISVPWDRIGLECLILNMAFVLLSWGSKKIIKWLLAYG